jgi:predicted dehydrogenase
MSDYKKLRFGICGLGFMGRQYFSHLRGHAHAEVVAVCDRDPRRRAGDWSDTVGNIGVRESECVDMVGISAYAEWDALIANEDVDVVAVTLPTPAHAEITGQALEAGKHVLCEKPMALTLAACDRMMAAAEKSDRTLMVGHCIRFWPQYEEIKQRVDGGEIGAVRFASLRRVCPPPAHSLGNWMLDGAQSGGALLDLHLHDVDFTQHLLGVPTTVTAVGARGVSRRLDHVLATYAYADGRYALIEGGWLPHLPYPFEMAIAVVGETGTLEYSMQRGPKVHLHRAGKEPEQIAVSDETGWTREIDYFIDCVIERRPPDRCSPPSSRTSIALALAEREAVESGMTRPFTDPGSGP